MKKINRLLLLVAMIFIALVVGGLAARQAGMVPHEERLPTPSPTSESTPDLKTTMGAEAALLSQGVGNALQETLTTPIANASPTLCPYNDGSLNCPSGMETLSPQQRTVMLMASATGTQWYYFSLTATVLAGNPTPTQASSTPTPTPTAQVTQCAFMWAHQDLPDVAQAARDALSTISIAPIQVVRADAYGETCGSSFGAMSTDFYLSVEVSDLSNDTHLAQIIKTAYTVLTALKVKLPAAPGYLDIQFTSNGNTQIFRAMFSYIKAALDAGKTGKSLVEVGGLH